MDRPYSKNVFLISSILVIVSILRSSLLGLGRTKRVFGFGRAFNGHFAIQGIFVYKKQFCTLLCGSIRVDNWLYLTVLGKITGKLGSVGIKPALGSLCSAPVEDDRPVCALC